MDAEVVIIGGGVAGCALATRLARSGRSVIVLEKERVYRDQIRGEAIMPWGYLEAVGLGLADVIMGTPGVSVISRFVPYDETWPAQKARARARDLSTVLPGAPGVIGVGHPELRQALADSAASAGAVIMRGVGRAQVSPGPTPSVGYDLDGSRRSHSCRLVVVADGKNSATRAALGIDLVTTRPRVMLAGLLVDDGGRWNRADTSIAVDDRNQFTVLPRADARIRLYVGRRADDPELFNGPDRVARFLEAYRSSIFPADTLLAAAAPVGPCATFPMTDAWTDEILSPGVVLLGDAAGWSNPVTAQGLSVALRDAKVLGELLEEQREWTPETLRGYPLERSERMRRLRFATALSDLLSGFGMPDRRPRRTRMLGLLKRQPELGAALGTVHGGPWSVAADGFTPDKLTTLALA